MNLTALLVITIIWYTANANAQSNKQSNSKIRLQPNICRITNQSRGQTHVAHPTSSRINLQRAPKILINRIQLRSRPQQIRRRHLPLHSARIILRRKLVKQTHDPLRRAREHAVLEVGPPGADADEAVGRARVAAEGDGVREVLVPDFAADFLDCVGGYAGEPVVGDLEGKWGQLCAACDDGAG